MGLLTEFYNEDVEEFSKDVFLLMYIVKQLDREYANADRKFRRDFKQFQELVKKWNKKYPNLLLEHYEDGIQMKIILTIKDNMKNVLETATKIDDLIKINKKPALIDKENISKLMKKEISKLNLVYNKKGKENSLTFRNTEKGVLFIYEHKDMFDKDSPEFEVCCYYALKKRNNINIQDLGNNFSFDISYEEREGKGIGYLKRFKLFDKI